VRLQLATQTTHVFLIGKTSDQGQVEHMFSREAVCCAADLLRNASEGERTELGAPCWIHALGPVATTPCERNECCNKWVVATEEGVLNVKFYAFVDEVVAKQYFDGVGSTGVLPLPARVLFDPKRKEVARAGKNPASFATILSTFACPTDEVILDGRWIVGAEHGAGNIKFYSHETEELARQFSDNGFLSHVSRTLFSPQGEVLSRYGWNALANNSVIRKLARAILPEATEQSQQTMDDVPDPDVGQPGSSQVQSLQTGIDGAAASDASSAQPDTSSDSRQPEFRLSESPGIPRGDDNPLQHDTSPCSPGLDTGSRTSDQGSRTGYPSNSLQHNTAVQSHLLDM